MKFTEIYLILNAIGSLVFCSAYRILGVFPYNGKSHNIILESVMKSLAKHGHQVDVVTHFPQKKPIKNYNDIINLDGSMERTMNNFTFEFIAQSASDSENQVGDYFGNRLCHFMGFEKFQKLVRNPPKDPPYDLVITEAFGANCYMGLKYVFKVPLVAISTAIEYPWVSEFIGNVDNPAIIPNAFLATGGKMNFWTRLKNVYTNVLSVYKFHRITEKSQTESMRKYLGPHIPNIREVEKNVALTLVNSHPSLFGAKPITPALIQIGGIHIEVNDESLSQELKQWMDESTHGVIYFNLGSLILIESLSTKKLQDIYASVSKISPVRVLMKIFDESKLPPGLPKNVKISPWLPQLPILAHPNTKAFITHGGLGGVQEALYHGIPMIGIPLFGDQFRNVDAFISKGMMIRLDLNNLTEKTLSSSLENILNNTHFKKQAVYHSKLYRDRPISATKSVVFWVEYIIRNGGDSLKSPALEFHWWQLHLLDIYGFMLLTFILITAIVILGFKTLIKILKKNFYCSENIKKKVN